MEGDINVVINPYWTSCSGILSLVLSARSWGPTSGYHSAVKALVSSVPKYTITDVCPPWARPRAKCFSTNIISSPHNLHWGSCDHPHFTDEETESQKGEVIAQGHFVCLGLKFKPELTWAPEATSDHTLWLGALCCHCSSALLAILLVPSLPFLPNHHTHLPMLVHWLVHSPGSLCWDPHFPMRQASQHRHLEYHGAFYICLSL